RLHVRGRASARHLPRPLRAGSRPGTGPLPDAASRVRRTVSLVLAATALALPAVAHGFDNTEPLATSQWYLTEDEAWSYWPTQPQLLQVRVAVIESGIDCSHPVLRWRVVAAKSFVGSSPYRDYEGHGTFVAGEI